jgi:hypothetical protein
MSHFRPVVQCLLLLAVLDLCAETAAADAVQGDVQVSIQVCWQEGPIFQNLSSLLRITAFCGCSAHVLPC